LISNNRPKSATQFDIQIMKFAFVADSQRYDIQTVYPIWSTNLVLYLPMDLHLLWMINVYT
jgi:hypothetical protein